MGKTTLVNHALLELNDFYLLLNQPKFSIITEVDLNTGDLKTEVASLWRSLSILREAESKGKRDESASAWIRAARDRLRLAQYPSLRKTEEELERAILNYEKHTISHALSRIRVAMSRNHKQLRRKVRQSELDPRDKRKLLNILTTSYKASKDSIRTLISSLKVGEKVYFTTSISLAQVSDPKAVVFRLIRQLYDNLREQFWWQVLNRSWAIVLISIEAAFLAILVTPRTTDHGWIFDQLHDFAPSSAALSNEYFDIVAPVITVLFFSAGISLLLVINALAAFLITRGWGMKRSWGLFTFAAYSLVWWVEACVLCGITWLGTTLEVTEIFQRLFVDPAEATVDAYSFIFFAGYLLLASGLAIFRFQRNTLSMDGWYRIITAVRQTRYEAVREAALGTGAGDTKIGVKRVLKRRPYEYVDAEEDFQKIITCLRQEGRFRAGKTPIFIFDELDKIDATHQASGTEPTEGIKGIIGSLKIMFTEPKAFYIFVAGREATDSWMEDLAGGDGLFEGVFSQNVYVPSLLCEPQLTDAGDAANNSKYHPLSRNVFELTNKIFDTDEMSPDQRELYHDFCMYLTLKSRGILRKFYRELYSFIEPHSDKGDDERLIVRFSAVNRNRVNFYAYLQGLLQERHPQIIKDWDDGARVSMYYLIEYLLKFYRSGFSWKDISGFASPGYDESAFARNHVVESIIRILEGRIIEKTHGARRTYRFDSRIRREIMAMVTALDEEHVEFRFRPSDFTKALRYLHEQDQSIERSKPEERTVSLRVQLSLGAIYERLEDHAKALHFYGKATRLGSDEIRKIRSASSTAPNGPPNEVIAFRNLVQIHAVGLEAIGYIYEKMHDYDLAALYYSEAVSIQADTWRLLALNEGDKVQQNRSDVYEQIARILPRIVTQEDYRDHGQTDMSLTELAINHKIAAVDSEQIDHVAHGTEITIRQEMRHNPSLAHSLNMLAYVVAKQGKNARAEQLLWSALAIMDEDNDTVGVAVQLTRLGDLLFGRKELEGAKHFYDLLSDFESLQSKTIPSYVLAQVNYRLAVLNYASGSNSDMSTSMYSRAIDNYLSQGYFSKAARVLFRLALSRMQGISIDQPTSTEDRLRIYNEVCDDLWNAIMLCHEDAGKEIRTNRGLDQRKYGLLLLYLGNFFFRMVQTEKEIEERLRASGAVPSDHRNLAKSLDFACNPTIGDASLELEDTALTTKVRRFERELLSFWEARRSPNEQEKKVGGSSLSSFFPGTKVDKALSCSKCYGGSGKDFNAYSPMLLLAEQCFSTANSILRNFIDIFDKAFLFDRWGVLYYWVERELGCTGKDPASGACPMLTCCRESLDLLNRARSIYQSRKELDPENLWSFADTCVDAGNAQYGIFKLQLCGLKTFRTGRSLGSRRYQGVAKRKFARRITPLQKSRREIRKAAETALKLIGCAERISEFAHRARTLTEIHSKSSASDINDPLSPINSFISAVFEHKGVTKKPQTTTEAQEEFAAQWQEIVRATIKDLQWYSSGRSNPSSGEILDLETIGKGLEAAWPDEAEGQRKILSNLVEPLQNLLNQRVSHIIYCWGDLPEKRAVSTTEDRLVKGLSNAMEEASAFYREALAMQSEEYEHHCEGYPIRSDLFYARDDFEDADEYWKQALHYKKRKRKASGIVIPAEVMMTRARRYVYSNRSVFSTRLLAQVCSATGQDERERVGTIYYFD